MEPNNTFAHVGGVPTAPPPPAEVKVRTMRSDLASMARSGGGLPTFENVPVIPSGMSATSSEGGSGGSGKKSAIVALIIAASVIAVALIGYVVYLYL